MNDSLLLSTAYFPPLSYVMKLLAAEEVKIEVMETFPKQTYRNRCEIATINGRFPLVVPVSKPDGNHTKTKDIEVSYRENWQIKHWRTLETAYNSSPFFIYYEEKIKPFFKISPPTLLELNNEIMGFLMEILEIDCRITYTNDYVKVLQNSTDLRMSISPKNKDNNSDFPIYHQVFDDQTGFLKNLSILDLIFNLGPGSREYLKKLTEISGDKK